jgi:hypothetical protein
MTPENFVYWLQGYFEITAPGGPAANVMRPGNIDYLRSDQLQVIRDHLKLVLEKKTPVRLPFSFSPPVMSTGIDPVYYSHNSPSPPASC